MAHRCRTCGEPHFAANSAIRFPRPEELAALDPLMPQLLEAAREFEANAAEGADVGTPVEWVKALAVECRQHTASFARARGTG